MKCQKTYKKHSIVPNHLSDSCRASRDNRLKKYFKYAAQVRTSVECRQILITGVPLRQSANTFCVLTRMHSTVIQQTITAAEWT